MVAGIWGQTRNLGDRTLGPADLDPAPVGRSKAAVVPRYGDRHDVRYADQERSTWNVQLATVNGVTERAHGSRDMGTDAKFKQPNFCAAGPDQARFGRSKPALALRYGDRHGIRHTDQERSTSNVQFSTFNGVTGRAHGGRDMGTGTKFGRPDSWPGDLDPAPVGRFKAAVVPRYGDRHDVRYSDQERST